MFDFLNKEYVTSVSDTGNAERDKRWARMKLDMIQHKDIERTIIDVAIGAGLMFVLLMILG